jgi:hypothetical protein
MIYVIYGKRDELKRAGYCAAALCCDHSACLSGFRFDTPSRLFIGPGSRYARPSFSSS